MPCYVDHARNPLGRMKMCHMIADTMDELLAMADKIGMKRKWFQPLSHPHFDLSLTRRAQAVKHGAIEVDRRELVASMKRYRDFWRENPEELKKIRAAARVAKRPAFLE